MSEKRRAAETVLARVRALLPRDWLGRAGQRFRQTLIAISGTIEEAGIRPSELPARAVALALDKVEGLAQKEKAAALRDFSEAEERQIDAQLKSRSLESRVRKEEAEASLAEITVINAKLDLLARLREAGVVLSSDKHGNYTALAAPPGWDFDELSRRLSEHSQEESGRVENSGQRSPE